MTEIKCLKAVFIFNFLEANNGGTKGRGRRYDKS